MSNPNQRWHRRAFLKFAMQSTVGLVAAPMFGAMKSVAQERQPMFKISLAEWSLHQSLLAGKLENLEFPAYSQQQFGIDAIEYVNQFFKDKANDKKYLQELKNRCENEGVRSLLIMVDREGELGHADDNERRRAVENHFPWVEAAAFLGCHSIRVNAQSSGTYDEQLACAVDGLRALSEFAARHQLNVIVENHGGLSSNGKWLASVMQTVNLPNCGTLPDFGNFRIAADTEYDRYQGVSELMPYAKAVSAKSNDFDEDGNEIHTDYRRMMKIVMDAGYRGHVGIEYEGHKVDEPTGIRLTRDLLLRIREEMQS